MPGFFPGGGGGRALSYQWPKRICAAEPGYGFQGLDS